MPLPLFLHFSLFVSLLFSCVLQEEKQGSPARHPGGDDGYAGIGSSTQSHWNQDVRDCTVMQSKLCPFLPSPLILFSVHVNDGPDAPPLLTRNKLIILIYIKNLDGGVVKRSYLYMHFMSSFLF